MADLFADPAVFAKVLHRYVTPEIVAGAVKATLPADITGDKRKTYVERLDPAALNDVPRQMQAIANDIFARKVVRDFYKALLRSSPSNVRLQGILSGEISINDQGEADDAALQSMENRRQPFISAPSYDSIKIARDRICAIWVKNKISGTGFLIASDLVLTARHVLDPINVRNVRDDDNPDDDNGDLLPTVDTEAPGSAQQLKCIFDYLVRVNALDIAAPPTDVRVVGVAPKWLAWSSRRHPADGRRHDFPYPPPVAKRLDCAVVQLEKPIGATAIDTGGTRLRGWISLDEADPAMVQDDIIAIWQHAGGGAAVFGQGTFVREDPSLTRVWYKTETTGGSSGSPCFDSDAKVVAFHNAGRLENFNGETRDCNQGIRIDHVIKAMPPTLIEQLKKKLTEESFTEESLWSVAEDAAAPQPVLGRGDFKKAVIDLFDPRAARRVIVVEPEPDVADIGQSGKSFSVSILKAIARGRPAVVTEFTGKEVGALTPENFLKELGRRIGLPASELDRMPARPQEERQITRWCSDVLPEWFGQRVEDRAVADKAASLEKVPAGTIGAAIGQELLVKQLTWIAIDDIHKAPPEGAIKELLAGMMGVTDTQFVLRPGLKALRWLIIGHVPDFVRDRSIEYVHDKISQNKIGEAEWIKCMASAFISKGLKDEFNSEVARAYYSAVRSPLIPESDNPAFALRLLSRGVVFALGQMLQKVKK